MHSHKYMLFCEQLSLTIPLPQSTNVSHASHCWISKWNESTTKIVLNRRHRIRNNQISIVALARIENTFYWAHCSRRAASNTLFGPKSPTNSWRFAFVLLSLYNNRQSIRLRRTLNNAYAFDYLRQFDWHYLFIAFLSFTSSIRLVCSSVSMHIVWQTHFYRRKDSYLLEADAFNRTYT